MGTRMKAERPVRSSCRVLARQHGSSEWVQREEGRTRFKVCILKMESKRFPNGLNVGYERKHLGDPVVIGLSTRRVNIAIN